MFIKTKTEWKKMVELNFREQGVTQFWGSFSKSLVTCELGADIKILMTNKT